MSSIRVFCCYAHEDTKYLKSLKDHLSSLRRQGLISLWADTNISPGTNWEHEIKAHLNTAQIILLLVSSNFMASEYCYSKEMAHALSLHNQGAAQVIPIILRPVYWQGAPFSRLQALPTDAEPIVSSKWHSEDEAWFTVVDGIHNIIQSRQNKNQIYYKQLISSVSKEIEKGRSINDALKERDPNLEALFRALIISANNYILEVTRRGMPLHIALSNSSPEIKNLFDTSISITSNFLSVNRGADNETLLRAEKILQEISAVGDGDLAVAAEVTEDTMGVLADSINFLIEQLVMVVKQAALTSSNIKNGSERIIFKLNSQVDAYKNLISLLANKVDITELHQENTVAQLIKELDGFKSNSLELLVTATYLQELSDLLYSSVSYYKLPQETVSSYSKP